MRASHLCSIFTCVRLSAAPSASRTRHMKARERRRETVIALVVLIISTLPVLLLPLPKMQAEIKRESELFWDNSKGARE